MKVAKVITTSFVPRTVREHSGLTGSPLGFFMHSQNFPSRESILDLINFTVRIEENAKPGASVDLIIVNNDAGWREGNEFLDRLHGRQFGHGKVHVIHRENFGRSFGGYNHAFKLLRNKYDYFIFTEDDILVARDGYASIAIKTFLNVRNCGFVAYQGITDVALDLPRGDAISAHGGVGLSSTKVLDDVVQHYGVLPHVEKKSSQAHLDIIRNGEIPFTNKIHKLGYQLVSVPDEIKLYDFAYDVMRGLDVKRFPTVSEKLIYLIKKNLYQYQIIRWLHQIWKLGYGRHGRY